MLADVVRGCPQQDCCSTAGKMGKGESKESSVDVFEYGKGTLIPGAFFVRHVPIPDKLTSAGCFTWCVAPGI